MTPTTEREVVAFYAGLAEPIRQELLSATALWDTNTWNEGCDYCWAILDGEEGPRGEECEHYKALSEGHSRLEGIEGLLPEEDRRLLREFAYYTDYGAPDWKDIPEGYYAVLNPDPTAVEVTYWRQKATKRGSKIFGPWPTKARYGPDLLIKDLPQGISTTSQEGKAYIRAWYERVRTPYHVAIVRDILEDPVAAGQRFADWAIRCCCCGRALTNDLSKCYGIGPECRRGMSSEVLANYYRPLVGQIHAQHLNEDE